MEENSVVGKKPRPNSVVSTVPPLSSAEDEPDRKTQGRAKSGKNTTKTSTKTKQMKVIVGGGRKRPPDVKDYIGQQLKAVYDDILNQPVPTRFTDLLQELASQSNADGE